LGTSWRKMTFIILSLFIIILHPGSEVKD